MAKKLAKTDSKNVPKLALPGVSIKDILEIEQFFPNLRNSLGVVLFTGALIAQLRLTAPHIDAKDFNKLESVRTYLRKVLSKSKQMLTVATAVAVKRTLAANAADTEETVQAQVDDLIQNPTGPSGTDDALRVCINNPARLRKLRRGLMLQTVGTIQAATIHNPTSFGPALKQIDNTNFSQALPFDLNGLTEEEIINEVKALLALPEGYQFEDAISLPGESKNVTALELGLNINRSQATSIAALKIPTVDDNAPAWKKAAVAQAKKTLGNKT